MAVDFIQLICVAYAGSPGEAAAFTFFGGRFKLGIYKLYNIGTT